VHTLAEYRGRGLAPRLLAAVEEIQRARGRRLAMLFSDIGLAYYERLGYVAGRSHAGWADVGATTFDGRLVTEAGTAYDDVRAECEKRRPFAICRTAEYGAHLDTRSSGQQRWIVENVAGGRVGGFSLLLRGDRATIEESFARDDDAEGFVVRAILAAARELGATRVGGWLPDTPATRAAFDVRPRDEELTMLKPLDEAVPIDAAVLAATDWLDGIDHV
jgi:hypothetical protein